MKAQPPLLQLLRVSALSERLLLSLGLHLQALHQALTPPAKLPQLLPGALAPRTPFSREAFRGFCRSPRERRAASWCCRPSSRCTGTNGFCSRARTGCSRLGGRSCWRSPPRTAAAQAPARRGHPPGMSLLEEIESYSLFLLNLTSHFSYYFVKPNEVMRN